MNQKYEGVICPEKYWEKVMSEALSPQEYRKMIQLLLKKVDALNERVYAANVRAEDAYQEMERLRAEMLLRFENHSSQIPTEKNDRISAIKLN